MKQIGKFLIYYLLRVLLWFRYRIRVEGIDQLTPENLNRSGGILFLPNHPTFFIDPLVTSLGLWKKYPVRPLIIEYMYYMTFVNTVMRMINALPVPDFFSSTNSLKRKKGEKLINEVIQGLKDKQNFLIYPSGKAKYSSFELIGGASAAQQILKEVPETNIVLVRIKGLWGSSFSRAISDSLDLKNIVLHGLKSIFKNLLFFTPRREVVVEYVIAPADFPRQASRLEMNRYLENWYNLPDGLTKQRGEFPGDSLVLVSYSMWKEDYLPLRNTKIPVEKEISLTNVPQDIQKKIINKLAELRESSHESIKPEMNLASDLGFDSLDIAEIVAYLQDQFDISGVQARELTTVAKLMAIAAKQIEIKENIEDDKVDMKPWLTPVERHRIDIPPGNTLAEVFLNQCQRAKGAIACADSRIGIQTYPQLKLRSILIAEYLRKLPGDYVGIMLPASVGANLLILACQIAGKVPLMINWTVGPRHLESVSELSHVKVVISSWAFIDRLGNVDLTGVDDMVVMIEDIVREITLIDKFKAFFRSKRSTRAIMKTFGIDKVMKDSPAVLLFTSGTESMPKGVPLTQNNLLSNLRSSLKAVELFSDDIIYGILPPFHSFGFTVSGILGLLAGCRVFYSPDPTDGNKLAKGFARWKITVMCGAPTFIKGLLKAASPGDIKSMRLCVTGAEKAPPELFKTLEHFGKPDLLMEGYGITECSPVLTMNPPKSHSKGVGHPLPDIELMIVHPETEQPLTTGERGLILAKGPNVFNGYINPSVASPFISINGERWYKTGDLGFLDDKGFLTLSGRMKRFVKMGGEMVSLASLEDALLQMGLKKGWPTNPDGPALAVCSKEILGEKTKLFLFSSFEIPVEDVNSALKESGFSNLVKVSSVIKLSELPIMGTGKINYRLLETEYLPAEAKLGSI